MKWTVVMFVLVFSIFTFVACQQEDSAMVTEANDDVNSLAKKSSQSEAATQMGVILEEMNLALAEEGANYRAVMAEYLMAGESGEMGATVFAKDVGNKQLSFDFVPFDPRREWSGSVDGTNDNITYAIDQTNDAIPPFGGLSGAETDAAIERAMGTWDEVLCSNLELTRNDDYGLDIGLIAFLNGLGGSPYVFADIQHCGWRDINFEDGVLGVTFTFGFIDEDGNFTDVNNDRKIDCAFREIYYDPSYAWADDGENNIDVESVAVHEVGHGLSQGHFGQVFVQNTGYLQVAPRAVMNALYTGPYRVLQGTDNGGHCSIWAQWPQN